VTSLLQFARQMGNTIGTAIFGTVLTLRFVPEVQAAMPLELVATLEGELLEAVSDPQALLLPESAATLRTMLEQGFPEHPRAVEQVFEAIRVGLAMALNWVFVLGAAVFGSGVLATLFLRTPRHPDSATIASARASSAMAPTSTGRSVSLNSLRETR
jgi:hypothetical protein